MDLGIISLIVASVSVVASIITALNLKRCQSACCESDCYKTNNAATTPLIKQPQFLN